MNKSRLNTTIGKDLIDQAKQYASRHRISLSHLVEQYFRSLKTSPNIITIVEKLPQPDFHTDQDLKKGFYEEQKEKYGF